jgi:hypothetical protein
MATQSLLGEAEMERDLGSRNRAACQSRDDFASPLVCEGVEHGVEGGLIGFHRVMTIYTAASKVNTFVDEWDGRSEHVVASGAFFRGYVILRMG